MVCTFRRGREGKLPPEGLTWRSRTWRKDTADDAMQVFITQSRLPCPALTLLATVHLMTLQRLLQIWRTLAKNKEMV